MKELEETNCEIRNVLNFTLPLWDQLSTSGSQEELMTTDGSKELNQNQTSGGFLNIDCKYAWLSHGTRLIVINVRCGTCVSYWNFPNKITSVSPFPAKPGVIPLLLIGLDNNAIRIKDSIGHLCIFDCSTTNILTTIQVPAGVEKACIIHGGTDWEEFNEKRPDTVLAGNTGLIFAALRNLQHVVIDINRSLWINSLGDEKAITAKLEFVNPLLPTTPNKKMNDPIHLAYDLMDKEIEQYMGFDRDDFESTPLYDESLCSVLLSSTKIGCLITGCLGRIIIWQNDGSIGWISPSFDENAYVTHIALLEPSDDPRPFYYLWIACQNDSVESSAVLRMYAILFNKKHTDKSGESTLYFNLESEPSLKFELELEQGERVHSLLPVERENSRDSADSTIHRGEDSLLLIGTDERLLVFDLNRWYKEQMPRTMAECRNPNSVMASYRTKQEDDDRRKEILACSFIPRSLREFPKGPSSPEELFYPNSLTLEWVELGPDNLTFWLARGVQAELLREILIAGSIVLVKPTETYRRCLIAGLVPFDSIPQDYSHDADTVQQREMLLSICLEQRWTSFLSRCANEWSDGSAAFLYPEFLRWGVQRASELKLCADHLCVPLFDQSGANIGDAEVRTLRFCGQQLECLSNVVSKLPNLEADLEKQRRALKRIAIYLQVLLWFYDVGLLPESQVIQEQEEDMPQISLLSKIPYPRDKLIEFYKKKRSSCKNKEEKEEDNLFIDQLIYHDCLPLRAQWKKEAGYELPDHGGYYPPPSLQSLLRSFLVDCHRDDSDVSAATASAVDEKDEELDQAEIESKHSITIYLLMDIAMLLQGTHPAVDHLIKYPSAFKLSPSLIKITQAFWLLDHEDYDGFFKIVTGQLILSSDIKIWHHKLAVASLLKNDQHKLALAYLRVLKPPLTSLEDQATIITLSVEQGLIESAFHARPPSHYAQLLTRFFQACKANGKLAEILQLSLDTEEEDAFIKFLKENGCEDARLLYYLQRCRHTEASDVFMLDRTTNMHGSAASKIHPSAIKVLNAFNGTLPDITRRFAINLAKNAASHPSFNKPINIQPLHHQQSFMDPNSVMANSGTGRCYPRPMSQCRDKTRDIYEIAVSKTRETCLKADRPGSSLIHVPFLDTPCSTIVFCTRASGNLPEPTDAYNVMYPDKKVISSKRTHKMMSEEEDNVDSNIERKKQRLSSEIDKDLLSGDNQTRLTRRLSMSNVCNTPLVQRKQRLDCKDSNSLTTETPHSILKIRQLLKRNSNSPGYGLKNGSADEKEKMLTRASSGDIRSVRQIRFSMDRMSSNDDNFSLNESKIEDPDTESNYSTGSKNIEEESGVEEYFSPNVSTKSLRDSSFLTDSSITKYIHGPRPRPSLKRSSMLSQTSESVSVNTTLETSDLEYLNEKSSKLLNASAVSKSILDSPSLYNASILCADTSIESSPFKIPLNFNNNERNGDDESEESDDQSEDDQNVIAQFNDTGVYKDSSLDSSTIKRREDEEGEEMLHSKEMETQADEEVGNGNSSSATQCILSEKNEISEDENEEENVKEQSKLSENDPKVDKEIEKEEIEMDDTFQSIDNSLNDVVTSETTNNYICELEENSEHESRLSFTYTTQQHTTIRRFENDRDCSLTKKIIMDKFNSSISNYSLTKPIFLDSHGIVKLQDSIVITDDESNDAIELDKPNLDSVYTEQDFLDNKEQEGECAELTLNFSTSDDSNVENKLKTIESSDNKKDEVKKIQNLQEGDIRREELTIEKETRSFVSEISESSSESGLSKQTTPKKKESMGSRSRLSSTKSDDLESEGTPLRRSSRQHTSITRLVPTPRRSIKSMSVSPNSKLDAVTCNKKTDRENQNTSVSTEVKKILSDAIASNNPAKLITEEQELDKILKSPVHKVVGRKPRTPRSLSREPSQDKTHAVGQTEDSPNTKAKRATRILQKDKNTELISVVDQKQTRIRTTRAGAVLKTHAPLVAKEDIFIESSSNQENLIDKPTEKKGKGRSLKSSKDTIFTTTFKKESEKERDEEMEKSQEAEVVPKSRTTRASSQIKDTTISKSTVARKTRVGSVVPEEIVAHEIKPTRKTRAGSIAGDQEEKSTRITRAGSVAVEEDDKTTRKTRAGSVAIDEENKSTRKIRAESVSIIEDDKTTRKTRAGSVTVDEDDKSTRKTRAGSVAVDEGDKFARKTRAGSVAVDEEERSTKKTRAGSMAVDEDDKTTKQARVGTVAVDEDDKSTRKTRAGSVVVDGEDKSTRKTRAVAIDEETHEEKPIRKTRGASVAKDEEAVTARKTRASSLAKETSNTSNIVGKLVPKRNTRATSLSKDISRIETSAVDETLGKRSIRKRGNSVPKDVPSIVEPPRIISRSRRSTSLLKEVILEESMSQLDSPTSSKRSKLPRAIDEVITSSPAANTRSRRSSIQSISEDLDEDLIAPVTSRNISKKSDESKDEGRTRRATSVDSTVVPVTGKRLTRSVLAKTSILDEIIPEEIASKIPKTNKEPTRRKRATSLSVEAVEEAEKEKTKAKPKRGRKASESKNKDFQFSPPEEAGQISENDEEECRTPTFKFSKPTGLQKFLTPIRFDDYEESSDVTTNALKCDFQTDGEQKTSARIQRRPRTCFVLPKKTKDKAN